MARKKKYLLRSINLGGIGHPARVLAEQFIKRKGKTKFSELVRKLIVIYLGNRPEHQDWKKEVLLYERRELGKNIAELCEKRRKIDDELRELGIDPELL